MYGDIFLAKAPGLTPVDDQLVCVKRLASREELIQMEFRREVEMFHKISHDRICRLLALCKEAEPIYMILEYCEWVRDHLMFTLIHAQSHIYLVHYIY